MTIKPRLSALVGLVGALLVWEAVPRLGLASPLLIPPPSALPVAFWHEVSGGHWSAAVSATLGQYLLGLSAGTVCGVGLGLASALSRRLGVWLSWLVWAVRPVPGVAWLPLVMIWFGSGTLAATMVTAAGVLWINGVATFNATRAVDGQLIELAAAYGMGRPWLRLTKVVLPAAGAGILNGIRAGAGLAWLAVIAAELVTSPGLGQRMIQASAVPAADVVLVYLVTIGGLVAATDALVMMAGDWLVAWRR
jgi:NitT/TauT family transport system permease protein